MSICIVKVSTFIRCTDAQVLMVLTGCRINYHHNFQVKDGTRYYYDFTSTLPEIIQVGEHQFVERVVIETWKTLMLVAW